MLILRHSERGAHAQHTDRVGKSLCEFPKKSIAIMVPADGQPTGHETVWQPKGTGQGAHTSENFRALGHTPVQFIQVGFQIKILL